MAVIGPRIVATGGAHVDRRGRVAGVYVPGASNPGRMREEVGGAAFNALATAVRRGASGAFAGLRGGDAAGAAVAAALEAAGIADLSGVHLDRPTPSYTALLDADGELIAGLADMALYEAGFARHLARRGFRAAAAAADALLIDANLPPPALSLALEAAGTRPVYAVAVSPAKAVRLGPHLGRLAGVFMTLREARALAGAQADAAMPAEACAGALAAAGLAAGIVTAGGAPLVVFTGAACWRVTP
ncbi:PfkB family carbohydrate kinase, partial [Aquibium sp. A9E412]|uniref:PfkB family carbohydrate kinase n=1 Tax=Aquibium sp. A9E412 TaxID=2976767 RepID=UPI0025B177A4